MGNLLAALDDIDAEIRDLENPEADVEDVHVESIADIKDDLNPDQVEVLDNALQNADTDALQTFLNDDDVLNDALDENDLATSDVVAFNVLEDGGLIIYVE